LKVAMSECVALVGHFSVQISDSFCHPTTEMEKHFDLSSINGNSALLGYSTCEHRIGE